MVVTWAAPEGSVTEQSQPCPVWVSGMVPGGVSEAPVPPPQWSTVGGPTVSAPSLQGRCRRGPLYGGEVFLAALGARWATAPMPPVHEGNLLKVMGSSLQCSNVHNKSILKVAKRTATNCQMFLPVFKNNGRSTSMV